MKKGLIRVPVKNMSNQEWVEDRNNGIGGSDVGILMGLNQFKCKLQLFHEKIGFYPVAQIDNEATYAGRVLENAVYDLWWKYSDPTIENQKEMIIDLLSNARLKRVIRKAKNVNSVIINPEHPWLRANLDKHIAANEYHGEGILEIKTALGFAMKKFEGGLPPAYIVQLMTYMKVCGVDYGEFALLKDGRFFERFPMERSESLCDRIVNESGEFWEDIVKGKEIVESGLPMEEMRFALQDLEPEPQEGDNPNTWEDYLKERYKDYKDEFKEDKIKATPEIFDAVGAYWDAHDTSKDWADKKKFAGNSIRDELDRNQVTEIELPGGELIKNYGKLIVPRLV